MRLDAIDPPKEETDSTHKVRLSDTTLAGYASARLNTLCRAAGLGDRADAASATLRDLLSAWCEAPQGDGAKWVSEISDDNTPVEFSVAIDGSHAEVRVLFESQGAEPTVPAYRAAGLALNEYLEREFGADLERLRIVQDSLSPRGHAGAVRAVALCRLLYR